MELNRLNSIIANLEYELKQYELKDKSSADLVTKIKTLEW